MTTMTPTLMKQGLRKHTTTAAGTVDRATEGRHRRGHYARHAIMESLSLTPRATTTTTTTAAAAAALLSTWGGPASRGKRWEKGGKKEKPEKDTENTQK